MNFPTQGSNPGLLHHRQVLYHLSYGDVHVLMIAAAAAKSLQSCPTLCDPIDGSSPVSPSLGFSRQEYWSGLPLSTLVLMSTYDYLTLYGYVYKLKLQYFGHLNEKNWLIWKDPDAGKDWRQDGKGMTQDEMVGWHHWLNGYEFG